MNNFSAEAFVKENVIGDGYSDIIMNNFKINSNNDNVSNCNNNTTIDAVAARFPGLDAGPYIAGVAARIRAQEHEVAVNAKTDEEISRLRIEVERLQQQIHEYETATPKANL